MVETIAHTYDDAPRDIGDNGDMASKWLIRQGNYVPRKVPSP